MTRGLTTIAALAATLVVALPAAAGDGVSLRGTIASLSATSVTFQDVKGMTTTCAVAAKSPSLDGYATGDAVLAACVRSHGALVLAIIRHATDAPPAPPHTVTFGGVVTALTSTSITLHDGDRDLTCALGPSSPSTSGVQTGSHVRVACTNGVLVKLVPASNGTPPPPPPPPAPAGGHKTVGAAGTVSAVSSTSLTVHTDRGDVTCAVGDGSPDLSNVHVGDRVKMGCLDGVVKVLSRIDAPPPPPPPGPQHTVTTVAGTLSVLSDTSVTVHSAEKGDVSCTVGPTTPHLGDFRVGDHVGMACVDGVVAKLVRLG